MWDRNARRRKKREEIFGVIEQQATDSRRTENIKQNKYQNKQTKQKPPKSNTTRYIQTVGKQMQRL